MTIRKNDDIVLDIDGYTAEGSAVGRHEGMAVFVKGAAEGDTICAHIIKVKKTYAIATLKEVITPSSSRVSPDCGVFFRCGGCCFRHISYEAECRAKKQRINDAFRRIGGLELSVSEFLGAENPDGYRNKAQLPVGYDADGKIAVGFYTQRSHRIVPCESCRLQPEVFSEISRTFCSWADENRISAYDEETHSGILRHLYLRIAEATGQLMVCIVINADALPYSDGLVSALTQRFSSISSIVLNINKQDTNVILGEKCRTIYGGDCIEDILCGVRVRISPLSFYQVNRTQAQRLYEKAAEFAKIQKSDTLLDLYCGAGTIGLSMADKAGSLIGVEVVPEAVSDARLNAEQNGITNARFICSDAAEAAKQLEREGIHPTAVIVDPPRKGCSAELIETIASMAPDRVVYVSCDPATLARDCAVFSSKGYEPVCLAGVDMFPRTAHVETVVLMSRTSK